MPACAFHHPRRVLRQASLSHLTSYQWLSTPEDSGRTTLPFSKDKSFRTLSSLKGQGSNDCEMSHLKRTFQTNTGRGAARSWEGKGEGVIV